MRGETQPPGVACHERWPVAEDRVLEYEPDILDPNPEGQLPMQQGTSVVLAFDVK